VRLPLPSHGFVLPAPLTVRRSEMSDNEKQLDDEFDSVEVVVERKGKKRVFEVREMGYHQLQKLTAALTNQDAAKRENAAANYTTNLIAASVSENGKKLTFEQAANLPQHVGRKLEKKISELNTADDEAANEAKNA
jgi:hypothetical protein